MAHHNNPEGLWRDWCAVVGHNPADRSEIAVARFITTARPSKRDLHAVLRTPTEAPIAPTWPTDPDGHPDPSLHAVLGALSWFGSEGVRERWPRVLRARRDAFVMVLLAQPSEGGLGLSRQRAATLPPAHLQSVRTTLGTTNTAATCPACAVHRWLRIAGLYASWSIASVQSAVNTPMDLTRHDCRTPDPEPEWITSRNLVPAINPHGDFDFWDPVSTRTMSTIVKIRLAGALLAPTQPRAGSEPKPPVTRTFTEDEASEVFAAADKMNRRLAAMLDETAAALEQIRH